MKDDADETCKIPLCLKGEMQGLEERDAGHSQIAVDPSASNSLEHPEWKRVLLQYNHSMPVQNAGRSRKKPPPPGETGQEALYLKFLSEKQVPVTVKLRDGEQVFGWIEYFDDRMIRLTREGKPNLFIYKHQVRTISETARRNDVRRDPNKKASGRTPKGLGNGATGDRVDE